MDIEYERLIYHKIINKFLQLLIYNTLCASFIGSSITCLLFMIIFPNQHLFLILIGLLAGLLVVSYILVRLVNKEWAIIEKYMKEIDDIIDEKIDEENSDSSELTLN